jgi:hypothetical protein
VKRYTRGDRAALPLEVRVHLVAARYGTSPELVRDWPADDFSLACALLEATAT